MSKSSVTPPPVAKAIRAQYEKHGAQEFYKKFGGEYRNPHEAAIGDLIAGAAEQWNLKPKEMRILDLACGSGEATLALGVLQCTQIEGVDPFTGAAYFERTGHRAEEFSFADVARGVLQSRRYDLCVCSFAMHLAPLSLLPQLCLQLSLCSAQLLILTPHKRPQIHSDWGWKLCGEILQNRVRARFYESANFQ